ELIATGTGTGGSSSIPCGGASVAGAAKKLAAALTRLAAEALEAGARGLGNGGGGDPHARPPPKKFVAGPGRRARRPPPAPRALPAPTDAFTPTEATYPNGTHLCEVEIDPATGAAHIVNYVVVDDFGVTVNPLLLAGQVHGGAVQGIGQALMERTVYDSGSGQ